MRVVCAGHVNWDVTFSVDRLPAPDDEAAIRERSEFGGGSAANAAIALSALGFDVRLLGSVGDDDAGRRAISDLEAVGLDVRVAVIDGAETTRKYVLVDDDGEVAVLGTAGANEALTPEDVDPGILDGADGLHLTGQRPETAARLAELAADRGVHVSFDPGRRVPDRDYGAVLERTDLLFATDREAATIDADVPWRVRKHGIDGATLVCPAGEFTHEGYGLASVDSTGAGDAFAAGFLAVRLGAAPGESGPQRALAVANACGALATSVRGPKASLSWTAIEDVLAGGDRERPD